ncbi:MAG: M48 family metalloprotease [Phycisphaerae bacterium]|nr:M48 family metalloprotease [Phycisphaerae bacterium]
MNTYASHMVSYLLAQSWQIALLAGIVGLISLALRNRSAHLRYLLWLIVLAKCLVPPFLTVSLAVLPERSSSPSVAEIALLEEHSALESPVSVGGATQPQQLKPTVPSVRELIALVWAAGAFLFLLWVGARTVRYTSWLRERRRPLPPALRESIRELSVGFQFKRWPRIWLLEDIGQPFVWGVLRGNVYLPADFVGLSGSDQQRSVLAHELSHIARFDAGVNLLQVLAQAVYWFHPFVWWSNRKIRQEREKCCDEMAIVHLNTPPEHYTGAIVDALAAERRSPHRIPSLAIVGSVKDIEERIKTMLKPGKKFRKHPSLAGATVALLIALVTIPTALVLTARGQVQLRSQSAEEPAATVQKPELPRFAARPFNSRMAFKVVVMETQSFMAPRRELSTPSIAPLDIPACYIWWVQPSASVKDWDLLAREIGENKVPGLKLDAATDSDVRHLAGLTDLRWLDLSGTQVGDAGLADLKGLKALEFLYLDDTQVTDLGLERLKGLTTLRRLDLSSTKTTDAGLENLKGLTGLRILWLDGTQITDAGLESLKDLTALEDLMLSSPQITDAGLAHLQHLTRLKTLSLGSKARITDAGLVHLKGLTRLETLDFSNMKITDAGLAHLEGLAGLQSLNLEYTAVTDAGLVHLRGLTRLHWLCLWGTKMDGTGLAHLKDLPRLDWLGLAYTQVTDAGLANVKGLTGLHMLWLQDTKVTDLGLEHLKGLTGLQRLDLTGTQTTDAGVQQLKQSLPKLTIVRGEGQPTAQSVDKPAQLPNKPAADTEKPEQPRYAARTFNSSVAFTVSVRETPSSAWKEIGRTPSRTPLEIPACLRWSVQPSVPVKDWDLLVHEVSENKVPDLVLVSATDSDLKHLAGLAELQSLRLGTSREITDAGLAHLASLTRLQRLDLSGTQVTDAGLEHLKVLAELQDLRLKDTQVTDAGLARLKGLTALQGVALEGTRVTDAGLAHLAGLTQLQWLELQGLQITGAGLGYLKECAGLSTLNLNGAQITDAGLGHLKGLTGLRVLSLVNTQITDAGLEHLEGLTKLQLLDLRDTRVTDAGLAHLKGLTGLELLYLANTQITDAGLDSLKTLTGLRGLFMKGTRVTDAGVQQLKQSLPKPWISNRN